MHFITRIGMFSERITPYLRVWSIVYQPKVIPEPRMG